MPNIHVQTPQLIKVRVDNGINQKVSTTSTFFGTGSPELKNQLDAATVNANNASTKANTALYNSNVAFNLANTSLQITGGEITGNLIVDGSFTAKIDGGLF